jgi:farnesyl diphosphate synthase/geranylgeranyl diphosphate synthase type II
MVLALAKASGDKGMVAGQAIDLGAVDSQLSLQELQNMHGLKTGALIRASVELGARATGEATTEQLQQLDRYACAIGLAFQVQDDILDVTASTETLGKQQGADLALNKPTYVSLLGLEVARAKAQDLHRQALAALDSFGERAEPLRQLSEYIISREH